MERYAIIDDNGVLYDGGYDEIIAIWNDRKYEEVQDRKGDILLVKILDRRK